MNYQTITRSVSKVTVTALAALMLIPAALPAAETQDPIALEKEGIELINQVEGVARDVSYQASVLNHSVWQMRSSKWVHLHHLGQIRELVNDGLRPALIRLEAIQPLLPEWKQKSIDKMLESAKALAQDTNAAILTKKDAGTMPAPLNAEYRQQLSTISLHADTLVKSADAAAAYARARLKAAEAGLLSKK